MGSFSECGWEDGRLYRRRRWMFSCCVAFSGSETEQKSISADDFNELPVFVLSNTNYCREESQCLSLQPIISFIKFLPVECNNWLWLVVHDLFSEFLWINIFKFPQTHMSFCHQISVELCVISEELQL